MSLRKPRPPAFARRVGRPFPLFIALVLGLAGLPAGLAATATATATAADAATTGVAITPEVSCGALATTDFTKVPDAPTRVLSATVATSGGYTYCDVSGYTAPQTQFQLELPTTGWLGQYVQEGCGGLCGTVNLTAPGASAGCAPVNNGRLAVSANDGGHVGAGITDGVWAADDQPLRVAFADQAEHAVALAAKAVIAAYYGQAPQYSYFDGCSNGGRQALMEAERYPRDFNGVLAGAPADDASDLSGLFEAWIYRSNTDSAGGQILTVDKLPALHAAVLAACAGPDGLVDDPRTCGFQPSSIQCPAGTDTASCLTPAQVKVVEDFYTGPLDQHGQNLYDGGLPYGSELAWAGWDISPSTAPNAGQQTTAYQLALNYLSYAAFEQDPSSTFSLAQVRFTDAYRDQLEQLGSLYNSTDPDLSAFRADGGRIILYHGWADQVISPFGTIGYYKAVAQKAGGYAASQAFSRLYMIPGQYHCLTVGGGDPQVAADFLSSLIAWVQNGTAPGAITLPVVAGQQTTLTQITTTPLDPTLTVNANGPSFNDDYHWVGSFTS